MRILVLVVLGVVRGVARSLLLVVALTVALTVTGSAVAAVTRSIVASLRWAVAVVLRSRNVRLPDLWTTPRRNVGAAGGDVVAS